MMLKVNPYAAPEVTNLLPLRSHRSWFWVVVLAFQILCYFAFVLFFGFIGFLVLIGAPSVAGRTEETVLALSALAFSPFVGWFAIVEAVSLLFPVPGRERKLAIFAVICTVVPAGLSLFSFYEYLAFGGFTVNAVPGFVVMIVALAWFTVTFLRLKNARRVVS